MEMEQQLAERIFTVIGELRRYLIQVKPSPKMPLTEMTVLHLIDLCRRRGDRASTTWLSERLKLTKSSVSQTLNSMEEKGWIRRSLNPDNRRQTVIDLTDEGLIKMGDVYEMMIASIAQILERMGRENAERFLELTEMFLDHARSEFQRDEKGESH